MVCTMSSASSALLVTIRAVREIIGAYSRKTASRSSGSARLRSHGVNPHLLSAD